LVSSLLIVFRSLSFSIMFTRLTIALFLLLLTDTSYGVPDLTPSTREYIANGMKFQQLVFKDEKQRIEYEPPRGWNFEGGANQLQLKPKKNFAEATITVTPLSKPQSLDENVRQALREQFMASLPVGSQFAKVEEEVSNPVLLNGNESFELTVSYQATGEKFFRSALFVNLRDTQLVFRLTARKDDFQALHREFKGSIFSWHWIGEKDATAEADQAAPVTTAP
jgi:hypothetical protein